MTTDDHFDLDSLEAFIEELVDAGFQAVPESNCQRWRGRIHPSFESLTDATTMDVVVVPGWPYQPPALLVQGLNTNHSTLDGLVCMWREGDFSHDWTTVSGLFSRVEEWCESAKHGWKDDRLDQDAFLNFRLKAPFLATFDLPALGIAEGSWGECHGVFGQTPKRLEVLRGPKRSAGQLRALWFHVGSLNAPPPRNLSEVFTCLPRTQRRQLQQALADRGKPDLLTTSGGVDVFLFCWERDGRPDLLVMACTGTGDEVEAWALQAAPKDEQSLILRAGPDAPMLRTCRVTVFGAGALGGHTATLLAESGVGTVDIVDPDVLLPGNVVRHVSGHSRVGIPKAQGVQAVIEDHAPWTEVSGVLEGPRSKKEIQERILPADIVVDTTGNEALVGSLAMVAHENGRRLVTGALYRGGFIARVRRQAVPGDTPIHQRDDLTRYPLIPAGPEGEDFASAQMGCSAPVNNAPPSAVTAGASLIAQVAIDVMTERFEFADEVIDVYRAIPEPPFHKVGRLGREW
ncbi:MAG: ThiF family adenylyltransferase [Chloroflexi bacterium]|nr:ThiF family adenylyltransferase [Chloroflexota bacterium]